MKCFLEWLKNILQKLLFKVQLWRVAHGDAPQEHLTNYLIRWYNIYRASMTCAGRFHYIIRRFLFLISWWDNKKFVDHLKLHFWDKIMFIVCSFFFFFSFFLWRELRRYRYCCLIIILYSIYYLSLFYFLCGVIFRMLIR